MSAPSKLARLFVPAVSLTLLAGYVVYSHQSARTRLVETVRSSTLSPTMTPQTNPIVIQTAFTEATSQQMSLHSPYQGTAASGESAVLRTRVKLSVLKKQAIVKDDRWLMFSSKSGILRIPVPLSLVEDLDTSEILDTTTEQVASLDKTRRHEVPSIILPVSFASQNLGLQPLLADRNSPSNVLGLDFEKIMRARRAFSPNIEWDAVLEPFEQTKYFCSLHGSSTLSIYNVPNKGWLAKYKRHMSDLFREFTRSVDGCRLSSEAWMPFPEMVDWRSPEPSFEERLDDVFDGKDFHRPFESWSRYFQRFPFP